MANNKKGVKYDTYTTTPSRVWIGMGFVRGIIAAICYAAIFIVLLLFAYFPTLAVVAALVVWDCYLLFRIYAKVSARLDFSDKSP